MSNDLLFLLAVPLVYTCVVLIHRQFGRYGLYAWISLSSVLSNLYASRQIVLFGLDATLGNILYASIFLSTDILSELYGKEHSRRAIIISVFCCVFYLLSSRAVLLFSPNATDIMGDAFDTVFSLSARVSLAGIVMYFLSNMLGIRIFGALAERYPDALWLRNNVATITCNLLENVFFVLLAFGGTFPFSYCLRIVLSTCILEFFLAICDTPFLYWGKKNGIRPCDSDCPG